MTDCYVTGTPATGTTSAQFHLLASAFAASVGVSLVGGYFIPVNVMEEVLRRDSTKESQVAIAAVMGFRRAVLRRILLARGVHSRVRPPGSEEHRKAILVMNGAGKSIMEISSNLGLEYTTVYRVLRPDGRVGKTRS